MLYIVKVFVDPFYSSGRRYLNFNPSVTDAYLDAHGTATLEGKTVTLNADGMLPKVGHVRALASGKVAHWVNTFNERASKA